MNTTPTDATLALMFARIRAAAEPYPVDLYAARRAAILAAYADLTPEAQANVREELAELDASDDTLSGSLRDAGFDSFGPM